MTGFSIKTLRWVCHVWERWSCKLQYSSIDYGRSSRGFHAAPQREKLYASSKQVMVAELVHHKPQILDSNSPRCFESTLWSRHLSTLTSAASVAQLEGESPVSDMLVDSFGRKHTYLRVSVTERCNLRCHYCMPAKGVDLTPDTKLLSQEELNRLAKLFVLAGVDKIRLTGGEPTVRPDIEELCRSLRAMPGLKTLAMTTNGLVLARKLPQLRAAGLDSLNISLDTLVPAKFEFITRRKGHSKVLEAVQAALDLGFNPVKVNCVVMRGFNEDEICDFVDLTRDKAINVRFIEFMPFDGNVWNSKKLLSFVEMKEIIVGYQWSLLPLLWYKYTCMYVILFLRVFNMNFQAKQFPSLQRLKDHPSDTAKNYHVEGFKGTVSFITSMTEHFCAGCNRLRLLADGNFKVSLRDAIRKGADDDALREIISAAVKRKKAAHAGMFELARTPNRPMIHIGG